MSMAEIIRQQADCAPTLRAQQALWQRVNAANERANAAERKLREAQRIIDRLNRELSAARSAGWTPGVGTFG